MRLTSLVYVMLLASVSWAQTIDYNQIITPEDYRGENLIEEELVRLAWQNHPTNEMYRKQVDIAEKNVTLSKWSWLQNFRAVYNINENTLGTNPNPTDPNTGGRLLAYPRYNIGLGVSLGDILTTPLNVNTAKDQVKIAEQELNAQKLRLRAEVLESYYHYQLAAQLLKIRSEENEEAYANFVLISEKFKTGESTLDEYNKIAAIYNAARATLVQQEMQLKIEKAKLESYIGVKLDTILE